MKNLVDYLKDKIYYILGVVTLLIILLVAISSCSSGSSKSYSSIESDMVSAAKEYYSDRKERLPKENGDSIKLTIATLIDEELLEEIKDPKNSEQSCEGYVQVKKVDNDYAYIPFLTCKGNYELEYLVDKIKKSKIDEYGNGVYTINNELVYRGDDVYNYVKFNEQLWRIVKMDSEGDIKLVLAESTQEYYEWDNAYNSDREENVGVTTDYLRTNIRKTLNNYYEENFSNDSKAKIVPKNLCIGRYSISDLFSLEKECSVIKEKEKIGLLTATDFQNASLDINCLSLENQECSNYNYLSSNELNTWLINSISDNSYTVLYVHNNIQASYANYPKRISPTIYITSKSIIENGKGTSDEPYVIK